MGGWGCALASSIDQPPLEYTHTKRLQLRFKSVIIFLFEDNTKIIGCIGEVDKQIDLIPVKREVQRTH